MYLRYGSVYLRPPEETDIQRVVELSAFSDLQLNTFPLQIPRNLKWFEERFLLDTSDAASRYKYIICRNDTKEAIGVVDVFGLNYTHGTCEVGYQIFQSDDRGGGLGRDAVTALITWIFSYLRINRIEANVITENSISKKLLGSLGFKLEGTRRQAAYVNGRFVDVDMFSLLKKGS